MIAQNMNRLQYFVIAKSKKFGMLLAEVKKLNRNDRYCGSFRPISFEGKGLL